MFFNIQTKININICTIRCHQCGNPANTHTNCAKNDCHLLFIQCAACAEKYDGCCGEECQTIFHLPIEERQKLRIQHADKYADSKIFKSRLRPKIKNKENIGRI